MLRGGNCVRRPIGLALVALGAQAACGQPPSARADASPQDLDAALDQLVTVTLFTGIGRDDQCEAWPAMPTAADYLQPQVVGGTLLFAGEEREVRYRSLLFEYDGARWTRPGYLGDGLDHEVLDLLAFGESAALATTTGVHFRQPDGTWSYEERPDARLPMGLFVVDCVLHAWYRTDDWLTRFYERNDAGGWDSLFATNYSVRDAAAGQDEIFVLTATGGLRRWDGQQLLPANLPTSGPLDQPIEPWAITDDGSGQVYVYGSPGAGDIRLLRRDGTGWAEETQPPVLCTSPKLTAPGGIVMLDCGPVYALLDGVWTLLPPGGPATVFEEGAAVSIFEPSSGGSTRAFELVDGMWQALPRALAIEVSELSAVDRDHAYGTSHGTVVRLAGYEWSTVLVPFDGFSAGAVHAFDENHFLVAGWREVEGGHVLETARWNGALWRRDLVTSRGPSTDAPEIGGMVARSSDDVYLAADCSLFRWDGLGWARIRGESCPASRWQTSRSVVALAGADDVLYARSDFASYPTATILDQWDGVAWTRVAASPWVLLGQLRPPGGEPAAATIIGRSPGQLAVLDASGWSAPVDSGGLWGLALAGTGPTDIVVAGADRLQRWTGSSFATTFVKAILGESLWTDGTKTLSAGGRSAYVTVSRCQPAWP